MLVRTPKAKLVSSCNIMTMPPRRLPSRKKIVGGKKQHRRVLPPSWHPSHFDVICKKGKASFSHSGNQRFRETIRKHLPYYEHAKNRPTKSKIVNDIVDMFQQNNTNKGGFVRQDPLSERWYEIGITLAREKVGYAIREELRKKDPASMDKKRRQMRDIKRQRDKAHKARRCHAKLVGGTPSSSSSASLVLSSLVLPPRSLSSASLVVEPCAACSLSTSTDSKREDESNIIPHSAPLTEGSSFSPLAKLERSESYEWFLPEVQEELLLAFEVGRRFDADFLDDTTSEEEQQDDDQSSDESFNAQRTRSSCGPPRAA